LLAWWVTCEGSTVTSIAVAETKTEFNTNKGHSILKEIQLKQKKRGFWDFLK